MHDIVKAAINAAGGLERWQGVRQISADLVATGAGFRARGPVGDALEALPMHLTLDTREQKVALEPYLDPAHRAFYEPERCLIVGYDGEVVEDLEDPRGSLKDMPQGKAWTGGQLLYFLGYAMWQYNTLPFNFLKDGVVCEEVEPYVENGETWRALKVTYPAHFPSHSTVQTHYFDDSGLMRRQDYSVDVRHNLGAAHYISDYVSVDGFMFPTRRRIYARTDERTPQFDKLLISADLSNYSVAFNPD